MESMAQVRFVNLVSASVRRYNKDILYRFLEGKLSDQKLNWWWYLFTTGRDNMIRLLEELRKENVLQDTNEPKNKAAIARLKAKLSQKRLKELGLI